MGGLKLRRALIRNSEQREFKPHETLSEPPTSSGVIDLTSDSIVRWAGIVEPEWLTIVPYGVAPHGSVMLFRLWGWSEAEDESGNPLNEVVPLPLADAVAVLNVNSSVTQKNARMADNIYANDCEGQIPTVGALKRSMVVHALGSRWIEFEFARPDGSKVEAMNAFWKVGR